jgi:DNA-binding GntR family transcriptional regulator
MVAGLKQTPRESTTVDRVVTALRQAMFEGRLRPGTQLREEMLSQQLGVSRSSVREALRVLIMDGLLQREPSRSVAVRHLTAAEVEDIFKARLVLEGAAVRASATCSARALEELGRELEVYSSAVQTNDHNRSAEAHIEFHSNMVRILTGSHWLAETERTMLRHLLLILATVHNRDEDLRREMERHRDLCNLCTARNIDEALACLQEGLDDSRAFAFRYTFEVLAHAKSQGEASWFETKA